MAKRNPAFARARRLAAGLPRVESSTVHGSPALKIGGKMFACIAIHKSAEPNTLAVRVPFADRDELIANDPGTFYLTDHYVDYPVVLVRLARVQDDSLQDLLRMGWAFMSKKPGPRARRPA